MIPRICWLVRAIRLVRSIFPTIIHTKNIMSEFRLVMRMSKIDQAMPAESCFIIDQRPLSALTCLVLRLVYFLDAFIAPIAEVAYYVDNSRTKCDGVSTLRELVVSAYSPHRHPNGPN
jgi:hypothetical protein